MLNSTCGRPVRLICLNIKKEFILLNFILEEIELQKKLLFSNDYWRA